LISALARPDFADPVSRGALVLAKFGHLESELDVLVGHSKRAAIAIVAAVLRERQRSSVAHAQAVWSGPPPTGQGTLAPYELLMELIATAERSVLFTGVDLQRDERLLRSLHAAQRGRELQVMLVLSHTDNAAAARAAEALFADRKPWPELFAPSPQPAPQALPLSLLADDARGVVLTGAAPVVEAPDHELTAGLLIENAGVVAALRAQWQLLIDAGQLARVV
jgi:xanthine/CO dehydrogenase XdhC/CoxF family maturation factor